MRRLIAYITLAVSMLIAIGVAATPILTKLHTGREFTNGREIVFRLQSKDEKPLEDDAAEKVAAEMRTRLDNFSIEDYSVKVQGNDTITASFSVEKDSFDYVAKYLCFSGEDFSISDSSEENLKENVFKMDEARIEYESDTIPVIVIPVTDSGKADLENLISSLNPSEGGDTTKAMPLRADEHDHDHDHDHEHEGEEGSGEEAATPDLYLWANHEEGDSLESASTDPLVRDKILMSFLSSNIWYTKSKEEHTEIAFICATAKEDNQLDLSGLKNDNIRANYLLNMIQAPKYEVSVECPTRNVTESGVDYYTNATDVSASAESLLSLGSNINIAMSTTLIATLVAVAIVTLLLVVYYRVNAIAMVATTLSTLFITLISFSRMSVLFNIPAIIGLIILAGGILFSEIVYANRFREEVYKGRSVKKANQEASRKSNLVTLDASIIMAFTGLMMYVLGGTALKPLGVVLFFGAVFALLMNLIIFKILMYLVTNSTNLQNKYNAFNIDGNKVPNLMSTEQKPEHVGAYDKVDFTKKSKLSSIILGIAALAAVAVITVFGVIDGSPLNVKNATKDTTVIYTELKVDNPFINDEDTFKEYALKNLNVGGDKIEPTSVEMKKVSNYTYDEVSPETVETYFFITKIDENYSKEQLDIMKNSITDALDENNITHGDEAKENSLLLSVRTSKELVYTPDQGLVALATGISIVGAALYVALRFGPSRGISLLVTTAGTTAIAYGIMVATRIGTTAVTSLAMPVVATSMMLASLFFFVTDKAMRKENRDQLTAEMRKEIMVKALSKSAAPMLIFMLMIVYISINYFGFGLSQTAFLFATTLVGQIISIIVLLTILGPLSNKLDKAFMNIHMPKLKMFEHKEKTNVPHKRNSSEPEETIFIGIND